MKERTINGYQFFIPYYKTTEIADPGKSPLNLPASLVSPEFASILSFCFFSVFAVGSNKINSPVFEILSKWVAVVSFVGNQSLRTLFRPSSAVSRHFYCFKRLINELYFRGRCRGKGASHRNTLAVCHHHPLRTFSFFGFSDAGAPFFAGAKLPSMKASDQSSAPLASNCDRNARQISNHTPFSSHSFNLRQQVEGLGYLEGRSHHLAPVRKIHKIPSRTSRFEAGGRPPFRLGFGFGKSGDILAHCSSFKNLCLSAIGHLQWLYS